jgi:hypothetical protein
MVALSDPACKRCGGKDGREIVARGVTETEPAACEQANEAARKMELIA